MRQVRWALVGGALAAAVLLATLAFAQVGGGRREGVRRPAPSRAPGEVARPGGRGQAREQALESLNLTTAQKASVQKALEEKRTAHMELMTALRALDETGRSAGTSDRDVQRAVDQYLAQRDRVMRHNADTDRSLMKSLPPRAQVQLLTMGMVDNGLPRGMGLMRGGRGGGMMRRGGAMGGRSEGGMMGGGARGTR